MGFIHLKGKPRHVRPRQRDTWKPHDQYSYVSLSFYCSHVTWKLHYDQSGKVCLVYINHQRKWCAYVSQFCTTNTTTNTLSLWWRDVGKSNQFFLCGGFILPVPVLSIDCKNKAIISVTSPLQVSEEPLRSSAPAHTTRPAELRSPTRGYTLQDPFTGRGLRRVCEVPSH